MSLHYFICHSVVSSVMLCFMILRFCSTVVFIVMMHHVNTLHFQMVYQLRNKMMVVNLNNIQDINKYLVSEIRVPISLGIGPTMKCIE